jgi:hypothetical protein
MFGVFKKKSIEVKYGHENYVSNYTDYKANDRNWILLLSALFVEAKDLDMWEHRARHDLLEIYPKGILDEEEEEELREDLVLNDIAAVKERFDEVYEPLPWNIEYDLYAAINSNSLKELLEKADDDSSLYKAIWKDKEKYEHVHTRIGIIAHSMWQIRMAAYFRVIDEEVAWSYLEKLADLARPLMTQFDSWEAYNTNLQLFHEIYEFEYQEERKYIERAKICLLSRKESPLHLIPFDFGVDKTYIYNIKSHSNRLPKRISADENPLNIMLEELISQEDKTKLFEVISGLKGKEYDRAFAFIMYKANRNILDEEELIELPERYNNIYAYAMRANYFYNFAWEARGTGKADTVGEENYYLFHERLGWALADLYKAYEIDPEERNIWSVIYDVLSLTGSEENEKEREHFYNLIKKHALDHFDCVTIVHQFTQTRWGGSFESSKDWARTVLAGTQKGDPIRYIIFWTMIEHSDYLAIFEKDEEAAEAIYTDKNIQAEVNQYFDELLKSVETGPYYLFHHLVYWYAKTRDYHRLRQLVHTRPIGKFELYAMNDEYSDENTEIMMNWFRSI